MKILFLDIDGVLNSQRSAVAFHGYPSMEDHYKFDQVSVELIRRICKNGVNIVLSSTWRFDDNYKEICQLPIIDRTPSLRTSSHSVDRGQEIKAWLDNHKEVSKWAIVDDDSDMLPEQLPNFVHVNGINGLLWDDYAKICTILEIKE